MRSDDKPHLKKELESLQRKLSELQDTTDKLKNSEEALKLDEARLEALLRLTFMANASEKEIADFALEAAIRLSKSEVGWIGALNEEGDKVILYNFSSEAMRECEVVGHPHSFTIENGGLWAQPIFQRKEIIINDYAAPNSMKKGFPDGHTPLKNFLAIPVFDDDRIVAVAEVGNKKTNYDRSDVRQLMLLMHGVWRIILQKRTEKALVESKAEAELYVDLMGHDINNINQVALGFLELAMTKLDREKRLAEEDRYLLERPIEALQNSSRLINNVKKLQSSKIGGLKKRLIDVGNILSAVIRDHAQIPGREVAIHYEPVEGYYVRANDLLRDVFTNLIGNSIKHSPADRPLVIDVSATKVSGQGIDFYVISVEDNGPGIPADKKENIFMHFEKGQARQHLSGLGLGLVKTLVDDYGGQVWAEDRVPGDHTKGVRIVVMLPVAQ